MRAIKYIGRAKKSSPLAKDFVQKLEDILQKHKLRLVDERPLPAQGESTSMLMDATAPGIVRAPTFDASASIWTPINTEYELADQEMNLDDVWWQKYVDTTANFDVQDWDELFADLNSVSATAWS